MRIHLILIVLLLLPISFALELQECQRVESPDSIPCQVISTYAPSTGCDVNVTIYTTNGTPIQNTSFTGYFPFCTFTFNTTAIDTYTYNSSLETGVITIENDTMLPIIIWQVFLIALFIAIGIPHKPGFTKLISWGLAVIELCMTVWMVYIVQIGGNIDNFLYINSVAVLVVGGFLGFLTMFMINARLLKGGEEDTKGDGWTKYLFK